MYYSYASNSVAHISTYVCFLVFLDTKTSLLQPKTSHLHYFHMYANAQLNKTIEIFNLVIVTGLDIPW